MKPKWSENIKYPPEPIPASHTRNRAYPFASTPEENFELSDDGLELVRPYIYVSDHAVSFRGQTGPINEVGVNGCQIDDIITFALHTLIAFNGLASCDENETAITHLQNALDALAARKANREARGVEGYDKK